MGSVPIKGQEIKMNGIIFVACGISKIVIASTAETEPGALFPNMKEGGNQYISCLKK